MPAARDLQEFCVRILAYGDLDTKLTPPSDASGRPLTDAPAEPIEIDQPRRDAGLQMSGGAERLPKPGELGEAAEGGLAGEEGGEHREVEVTDHLRRRGAIHIW